MVITDKIKVKYTLFGKLLSNKEVESNKHLFDPRCFSASYINPILMGLLKQESIPNKLKILYVNQDFTLKLG